MLKSPQCQNVPDFWILYFCRYSLWGTQEQSTSWNEMSTCIVDIWSHFQQQEWIISTYNLNLHFQLHKISTTFIYRPLWKGVMHETWSRLVNGRLSPSVKWFMIGRCGFYRLCCHEWIASFWVKMTFCLWLAPRPLRENGVMGERWWDRWRLYCWSGRMWLREKKKQIFCGGFSGF